MAGFARCCAVGTLLAGLVTLIVTISGRNPLLNFINDSIKQQVQVLPGSATYDNWKDPPVPVLDNIYLFNISNVAEFNAGQKAIVERIGPFVYRKHEEKRSVNFTGDLNKAMFYDYEDFQFDELETQKLNRRWSLGDRVFIPNVPLIAAVSQIETQKLPETLKKLLIGEQT
eukprot:sb/3472195/